MPTMQSPVARDMVKRLIDHQIELILDEFYRLKNNPLNVAVSPVMLPLKKHTEYRQIMLGIHTTMQSPGVRTFTKSLVPRHY